MPDLPTIDRELGWAKGLGFNSIRVFLHHLPGERDPQAFLQRIEQFLATADRHKIGVISFHNYKPLPELKGDVEALKRYGRPILCT